MNDFEILVSTMRNLQKAYFKTRDGKILEQSKAAEKAVDKYLAEKINPSMF